MSILLDGGKELFMKLRKPIVLFTILSVILGIMPAAAAAVTLPEDTYFAESFDNYTTNLSVDIFDIEDVLRYRIVDDGNNNKAFMLNGNSSVIKKSFGADINDNFVFTFDFKTDCKNIAFDAGIVLKSGEQVLPVNVRDGKVMTSAGQNVASVGKNKYVSVAMLFNLKYDICNVYINKKCVISDIPVENIESAESMVIKLLNVGQSTYLDNVAAYPSDSLLNVDLKSAYNNDYLDYIDINDWTGSFEYWNMYYMNLSGNNFTNVTMVPKDNTIECPRFDYKNKYHENWLKLIKTTSNDCYFDIAVKRPLSVLGPNDQIYKYFVFSGDFMTESGIQNAEFPLIRDSKSYSANCDSALAYIRGSSLVFCDGTTISDVIKPNVWFHYTLSINLVDQTISAYIDMEGKDTIKVENLPIVCIDKTKSFNYLSMVRVSLSNGNFSADLKMENCYFNGYEKPYVYGGGDPKTSIFYDDSPVADYLSDKIAFHAYAKTMMVNGEKYDISDEIQYDEENDEIYVKAYKLMEKLCWKFDDPDSMVPIKQYVSGLEGWHYFSDKNGMILISQNDIKLSTEGEYQWFVLKPYTGNAIQHTSQLEALNDYVFFDRPEAEELSEMFEKVGKEQSHPRVYADKERFDELRELYKTDETFKKWADTFISKADEYIKPETPYVDYVYDDVYRMMSSTDYPYQQRMISLGFAYQMTGDKKYAERAYKEFEMISTFPDINPGHIIDTGVMNEAIAIGYDWMYDAYTPEQRAFIENIAIEKGIKPIASGFYGLDSAFSDATFNWFAFKTTQNYNAWVVGGLFESVCAFYECDEEYLSDVAEKCIRSMEYSVKGFAPDGGWLEGIDYWHHTTRYLAAFAVAAENTFGSSFKMLDYQGVSEAPEWAMSISGILGVNNFGDATPGSYTYETYSFFNDHFGNRTAGSLRKYDIETDNATPEMFDIIFYDESLGTDEFENMSKLTVTRGIESCGVHISLTDKDALFFSAHGGADTGYHTHYDTGAFVFDLDGVRWAEDLGKEDYNIGLANQFIYRKRSEAHNTITINNSAAKESMTENGFAPIIDHQSNDRSAFVAYDMTSVFEETDKHTRGFYIGDDYRSLTVRDEIVLNQPSEVYWTMNTKANVIVNGNEAILLMNGKSLSVKVECDAEGWEFKAMPCEPLEALPKGTVDQMKNDEYTKLAVRVDSSGSFNITVKLASTEEAAGAAAVDTTPIENWKLLDGEPQETTQPHIDANIYADGNLVVGDVINVQEKGRIPEIEVEPINDGYSYEIVKSAENLDDTTEIKVYNEDKSAYKLYLFKYSDNDVELWKNYNVLDIVSYEVSQQRQPENAAPNMFDGDFGTRWTSLNEGEYVTVDLGSIKNICGVAMGFWQSKTRSYNYTIQVSDDGVNYRTITSGSSPLGPEEYTVYNFDPVDARYVRIIGTGNTENVNTNILELRVLGNKEG